MAKSRAKLLVQPADGADPLLKGIGKAKKNIKIVIFRFDRAEITRALVDAVERGVAVHALIAFTNRGGERRLRQLETEFLANGITVARTAGDLVRYHGKMLLVDDRDLYLLAFNLTHQDIDHSRSFGLATRNAKLVKEAARLFDADSQRQVYTSEHGKFVVSPVNARRALSALLRRARQELLIYDPKITDKAMLRLLEERRRAGVKIRIIGRVAGERLPARELARLRLHARVIVRDGCEAFLGSQSLRQVELDARREMGAIFRDRAAIKPLVQAFEDDWAASEPARDPSPQSVALPLEKAARKLAKKVTQEVPVEPVVKKVVRAVARKSNGKFHGEQLEKKLESAVKQAMKQTVKEATRDAVKTLVEEAS